MPWKTWGLYGVVIRDGERNYLKIPGVSVRTSENEYRKWYKLAVSGSVMSCSLEYFKSGPNNSKSCPIFYSIEYKIKHVLKPIFPTGH